MARKSQVKRLAHPNDRDGGGGSGSGSGSAENSHHRYDKRDVPSSLQSLSTSEPLISYGGRAVN
eukprot:7583250-Pyramimonas_sp.AAC.1